MVEYSGNIALAILASALAGCVIYIIQTNRSDLKDAREFWHGRFTDLQNLIIKLVAEVAEMKGRFLKPRNGNGNGSGDKDKLP